MWNTVFVSFSSKYFPVTTVNFSSTDWKLTIFSKYNRVWFCFFKIIPFILKLGCFVACLISILQNCWYFIYDTDYGRKFWLNKCSIYVQNFWFSVIVDSIPTIRWNLLMYYSNLSNVFCWFFFLLLFKSVTEGDTLKSPTIVVNIKLLLTVVSFCVVYICMVEQIFKNKSFFPLPTLRIMTNNLVSYLQIYLFFW